MLIEFHVIRDHGPANMNRGQDGQPKTAIYGGKPRLRVSSQCWKRTLRQPRPAGQTNDTPGIFERTVGSSHFGVRTRLLPELVADAWKKKHGDNAPFVEGIKAAVSVVARKDGKEADLKADGRVRTPQAIYLDLDREVERIVGVLNRLHSEGTLEEYVDESKAFDEHLANAAEQVDWQGKDPVKAISWESVKTAWPQVQDMLGNLDIADRPAGLESLDVENLQPTYELAEALLRALQAITAQNEKGADRLLKELEPAKGKKKSSGPRQSLAKELKVEDGQPVSAADIALFGRMTTSEAFSDVEAACQVADALSTHPVWRETDYFTAVDDLDTGSGAAHVGEAAFASAVFYHNIAVDFRALLRNLGAELPPDKASDPQLQQLSQEASQTAARAVEGLLRAIMHNVPSGKVNSHAHNQAPSLILVEVKPEKLPTNYLTAFHSPAQAGERPDGSTETLLSDSVRKLLSFARYRHRKMPINGTLRFLFANDEETEQAIERLRESLRDGDPTKPQEDSFFQQPGLTICDTFEDFVQAVNGAVEQLSSKEG